MFLEVAIYLPDEKEFAKLPRQWVINIFYTVVDEPLAQWANFLIQSRNEKLFINPKLFIDLYHEIARAFH